MKKSSVAISTKSFGFTSVLCAYLLALEFSPIRLNAVSAGLTDTPFWDNKISQESREAMFTNAIKSQPIPRAGTPEDIAGVIAFAVSNGYTTGTVIECDPGGILWNSAITEAELRQRLTRQGSF